MEELQRRVGHVFADQALLRLALTHSSFGSPDNERLEYLGDATLGFLTAVELMERFPAADEGFLSRARAALVTRGALAACARSLGLGEHMRFGVGKGAARDQDSVLADGLEALIGALYQDGGIQACRQFVRAFVFSQVAKDGETGAGEFAAKDSKTRLQEYLQARGENLPSYSVVAVSGEEHERSFRVACEVPGLTAALEGQGASKRRAEKAAAARVLRELGVD